MPQMYKKAPKSVSRALMTSDNIMSNYTYQTAQVKLILNLHTHLQLCHLKILWTMIF